VALLDRGRGRGRPERAGFHLGSRRRDRSRRTPCVLGRRAQYIGAVSVSGEASQDDAACAVVAAGLSLMRKGA
jgi:hypothetical protein